MTPTTAGRPELVILWGIPRSVSTGFAKALSQTQDTVLLHEPWTAAYYSGPDRRSSRYDQTSPRTDDTAANVRTRILDQIPAPGTLLVKELTFQGLPYLTDELARQARHAVITRHPAAVYNSLARLKPDFTREEFGFTQLRALLARLETLGRPADVVVDGDVLCADPLTETRRACAALTLPFDSRIVEWADGRIREWTAEERQSQAPWHRRLEASQGLIRRQLHPRPVRPGHFDPPEREGVFDEALGIYGGLFPDLVAST